jgi:trimethylamine:corrinoid methyltransferase-like protein
MGAGTPVNVFDLETGVRRPATRQDVRDLVMLQDALPQVDIVTPENVRCMLRWAEHGFPIILLSMAMGSASAPATLLGELVVINTDVLAWIVALQVLHPGLPLLYGSVSAMLDMCTGLLPLGAPDRGMINSGTARMARYYGIPSMCGGLSSDAKELDAQAGYEKAVTAFPLLLEGADIIYGVGGARSGADWVGG